MKRIISLVLVAVMLLSCAAFCGCSHEEYQSLITYGAKTVNTNTFTYILTQAKTLALYSFGQTSDSSEVWDTEAGQALAQYIFDDAVNTAMSLVYYADVAEQNGVTLTKDEEKEIKDSLDDLMSSYNVDKKGLNSMMAEYGMNYNLLTEYYKLQKLANKGKTLVLGEGGTHAITDDDYMEYYTANYYTIRHLNLNNINKVGENGKEVILTDDEKAAVNAQADDIELSLAAGATLVDYADVSSDDFLKLYPAGITVPLTSELYSLAYAAEEKNSDFNVFGLYYYLINNVEGFADAVTGSAENAVSRIETDKGIFFVQHMPLDTDMFELYKDIIAAGGSLESQKTKELMTELKPEFSIDDAALATFTVKGAAVMALQ